MNWQAPLSVDMGCDTYPAHTNCKSFHPFLPGVEKNVVAYLALLPLRVFCFFLRGSLLAIIAAAQWEYPAYSNCRLTFLEKLQELLGDKYIDFDSLNYLEKTSYVLGSELWEDDFSSLLSIVKEFIVDVWESRKLRLYGENACPGPQPNSSGWDLGQDGKLWNGRNGRSGKLSHSNDVIGACICSNDVNVCGSAHCGCVVNGSVAMAAF
jgi:hypothetical protein